MCKSYAARQTSAECSAGSTERTDTGEPTAAAGALTLLHSVAAQKKGKKPRSHTARVIWKQALPFTNSLKPLEFAFK